MEILKLSPVFKDYIWGGTNLKEHWNKKSDLNKVAESWELSFHKDGESRVCGGSFDGKMLSGVITKKDWGTNCAGMDRFPILIKIIDAGSNLSVQVHPCDGYALRQENDLGKTEMWYIADAEKGAGIYLGFNKDVSKAEFERAVADNTVEKILNFVPVKKGDSFLIECGTVHAICAGITVCEIQQNSNVTYRVYDYGRRDGAGNKRELHIDKAIDVLDFSRYIPQPSQDSGVIASCKYFTVSKYDTDDSIPLFADSDSFNAVNIVHGQGEINGISFVKGDTFFVPAGFGEYTVSGNCTVLVSKV